MNGDQLETKLKNGWGARIAAGVVVILLSTATIGTHNMSVNFAKMTERLDNVVKTQDKYIEKQNKVENRMNSQRHEITSLDARVSNLERKTRGF